MLYNLSVTDQNIDPENFSQMLEVVHAYIWFVARGTV